MKIIIGSESFAPNISGVCIYSELLAKNLSQAGHQVYVFAPSRSYKTHRETMGDITVVRLKSLPNPFRKGFRIAFLPGRDIKKAAAAISPDLIHLQDPTSICSALRKFGNKHHIPVIITNHFSLEYIISYIRYLKPFHPQIRVILKKYLSNFYNKCDYVFCPTDTVKQELKNWGVESPTQAISNGVDLDRFYSYSSPVAIKLKYHLPTNPVVLYLGRIDKDKSINVLIDAIPKVHQKVNAHFLFVGGGDELPKMKKLTEKMGIQHATTFLGAIAYNSPDLPQLYQFASVFAIPSTIETQSIVTLEAMASGLPIVAARAGALPELVKNNANGFLFSPGNSDECAAALIKVLTNPNLRQRMSLASLESVTAHQISESFAKISKIYEQTCQKVKK